MKNLIISILSMQIITGLSFWEFQGNDRIYIGVVMVIMLWVGIEALDEVLMKYRRSRRMKKRRAERFALEVVELTTERKVV